MLAAPTIPASLGTQQVNAPHAPSGQPDHVTASFADSFDERSAALTGEVQTHVSDGDQTGEVAKSKEITPEIIAAGRSDLIDSEVKAGATASGTTGVKTGGAKALPVLSANAKDSGPPSARAMAAAIEALRRHGGHVSKEVPTGDPTRLQDRQISSKNGKDVDKIPVMDQAKTDDTQEEAVAPPSSADSTVVPVILDKGAKQDLGKLNEILDPAGSQAAAPAKRTADGHEKTAKTEKAARAERKDEKSVGTVVSPVGAEAAKIVNAFPVLSLPEKNTNALSASEDDAALSSITSAKSGQSAGTTFIVGSGGDKKSAGTGQSDGDSTKAADIPSVKDPASEKPEKDVEKMAAPAVKAADRDRAEQKVLPATVVPATEIARTEQPAGVIGGIPAGAATHVVAAKAQTVEVNPHAASVQSGSAAIDPSGSMDAPHKTLIATPTTLEVGVANGTHGWLRIRAEMTGGGAVNASLSTATPSGQEMLHRELPSLTAYLQSERVAVNAVVVQPAITGAEARGLAGGMNGSGSGQPQQGSNNQGGENRQTTADTLLHRMDKAAAFDGPNRAGADELLPPTRYAGGGSWLSVRA